MTMTAKLALRLVGVCTAAAVIAVSCSGIAQAVTDTAFKYRTPKTGWFGLAPASFRPQNAAVVSDGYLVLSETLSADASACFKTGVNLPHGARITAVAVWYSSDTTSGVGFRLLRNSAATGAVEQIGAVQSTNTGQVRKSMSPALTATRVAVDNQRFSYAAEVCLAGANDMFHAGRINYTYASAGD